MLVRVQDHIRSSAGRASILSQTLWSWDQVKVWCTSSPILSPPRSCLFSFAIQIKAKSLKWMRQNWNGRKPWWESDFLTWTSCCNNLSSWWMRPVVTVRNPTDTKHFRMIWTKSVKVGITLVLTWTPTVPTVLIIWGWCLLVDFTNSQKPQHMKMRSRVCSCFIHAILQQTLVSLRSSGVQPAWVAETTALHYSDFWQTWRLWGNKERIRRNFL